MLIVMFLLPTIIQLWAQNDQKDYINSFCSNVTDIGYIFDEESLCVLTSESLKSMGFDYRPILALKNLRKYALLTFNSVDHRN